MITALPSLQVRCHVHDLGPGSHYGTLRRGMLHKLLAALRLGLGTLAVFVAFLAHRTPQVYVTYPAPALVLLLGLLPRRLRPRILLDAFISLYDTVVHDRALLCAGDWKARLLFTLERRAFALADIIVVDTPDNARYYADLFALPPERFRAVPLCIPPLPSPAATAVPATGRFTCLFIGSLVPLHGLDTLLAAIARLSTHNQLDFVIMGDGQDGPRIEAFLLQHPEARLRWLRGLHATGALVDAIAAADLCLGIFGSSAKAARVVPYKLYYYAALGKPFVTQRTPCLDTFCGELGNGLLSESGPAAVESLAGLIERHLQDAGFRAAAARAAETLYRTRLAPAVITTSLTQLFDAT